MGKANGHLYNHTGSQNAFLCKRKQAGGVQFSRDPLNLVNKHSRKYAGYANDKVRTNTENQHTLPHT